MPIRIKCNACGDYNVTITQNGNLKNYMCHNPTCLTAVIVSGSPSGEFPAPKEFTVEESTDILSDAPLKTKRINPILFWDRYIRKHVDEFYDGHHFAPVAFKLHIEPGKSYIIAEGIQSHQAVAGNYISHGSVTETKRFPDNSWTLSFWNDLMDNFDLPRDSSRAVIESQVDDPEVEIKVAVTLRQSFERATNRTVTKAEADMLRGQVINSTPVHDPGKKDIISYVAVSISDPDVFLGPNYTQVSNIKRAQHFATESMCRSAMQISNKMYRVKEVIE